MRFALATLDRGQDVLEHLLLTVARQAGRDLPLEEMIDEAVALADELMNATKKPRSAV